MNKSTLSLKLILLFFFVLYHAVKQLGRQTAISIIAAIEAISSLTRTEGDGNLRKCHSAIVVNNDAAVFVDGKISVLLFVHIIVLS